MDWLGPWRDRRPAGRGRPRARGRAAARAERVHDITISFVALGGGDTPRALDALEHAKEARETIGFIASFGLPAYDPIRRSARFAAAVRAFGAVGATRQMPPDCGDQFAAAVFYAWPIPE